MLGHALKAYGLICGLTILQRVRVHFRNGQCVQPVDATLPASVAGRGSIPECLLRSRIELGMQFGRAAPCVRRPRSIPCGKYWREQTVRVLVRAPFPWTAGVTEVDRYVRGDGEALVLRELEPPVEREQGHEAGREPARLPDERDRDGGCALPRHFREDDETRAALDERGDVTVLGSA